MPFTFALRTMVKAGLIGEAKQKNSKASFSLFLREYQSLAFRAHLGAKRARALSIMKFSMMSHGLRRNRFSSESRTSTSVTNSPRCGRKSARRSGLFAGTATDLRLPHSSWTKRIFTRLFLDAVPVASRRTLETGPLFPTHRRRRGRIEATHRVYRAQLSPVLVTVMLTRLSRLLVSTSRSL